MKVIRLAGRRLRSLAGLRHFRGHGIHSPFVYGLKRRVMMRRIAENGSHPEVGKLLHTLGIGRRTATEIQNLHKYCCYTGFRVLWPGGEATLQPEREIRTEKETADKQDEVPHPTLTVLLNPCGYALAIDAAAGIREQSGGLVIITKGSNKELLKAIQDLRARKECLSVENRHRYVMFFYNSDLPVQHFML